MSHAGFTYTCVTSRGRLAWGKPIPITGKAPQKFEDLITNASGIAHAAWSKSRTKILNNSAQKGKTTLLIGPNTKLSYPTPELAFSLVQRMYAGFATPQEIFYLAFSYGDREWAISEAQQIVPSFQAQWLRDGCQSPTMCWAGGAFLGEDSRLLVTVGIGVRDVNTTQGPLEAHEFTHAIQQTAIGKPHTSEMVDPWPPSWFWEGQAQFTQHAAIYHQSFERYLTLRRDTSGLFGNKKYSSSFIAEYFRANQPADVFTTKYERWRQYDLGAMFIETLVALRGPDAVMTMYRNASSDMPFTESFQKTFDISYDKALPYISRAIAAQLGNK